MELSCETCRYSYDFGGSNGTFIYTCSMVFGISCMNNGYDCYKMKKEIKDIEITKEFISEDEMII